MAPLISSVQTLIVNDSVVLPINIIRASAARNLNIFYAEFRNEFVLVKTDYRNLSPEQTLSKGLNYAG